MELSPNSTPLKRHPFQYLESPSRSMSLIIHATGLSSFAASFKFLVDHPNPANEAYGWHLVYLTIIGLSFSSLTFLFGSLADLTLSRTLFTIKNALSILSTPLELLISLLYWSLRVIDSSLVLPPWSVINTYADIGFHLMPAIMLSVDFFFLSPPWVITTLPSIGICALFALAYWGWVETCYVHNGWYPYPLFQALDTPHRVLLFMGSAIIMATNIAMLKWLYARVNAAKQRVGVKANAVVVE